MIPLQSHNTPFLASGLDSVGDGRTVKDAAIVAQVAQRFDALSVSVCGDVSGPNASSKPILVTSQKVVPVPAP
jgi:hypothetical protein